MRSFLGIHSFHYFVLSTVHCSVDKIENRKSHVYTESIKKRDQNLYSSPSILKSIPSTSLNWHKPKIKRQREKELFIFVIQVKSNEWAVREAYGLSSRLHYAIQAKPHHKIRPHYSIQILSSKGRTLRFSLFFFAFSDYLSIKIFLIIVIPWISLFIFSYRLFSYATGKKKKSRATIPAFLAFIFLCETQKGKQSAFHLNLFYVIGWYTHFSLLLPAKQSNSPGFHAIFPILFSLSHHPCLFSPFFIPFPNGYASVKTLLFFSS